MGLLEGIKQNEQDIIRRHKRKQRVSKEAAPGGKKQQHEQRINRCVEASGVAARCEVVAPCSDVSVLAEQAKGHEIIAEQKPLHSGQFGYQTREDKLASIDAVGRNVLRITTAAKARSQGMGSKVPGKPPAVHFPTQQAAFDFQDDHKYGSALLVFSYEMCSSGKRSYFVTTPTHFWAQYAAMVPRTRHWYEIIRIGAPVHLYFDLEFARQHNPGVDGQQLTDRVIDLVELLLVRRYRMQLERCHILELDSSTPAKFSRHLVVKIPGHAFPDNLYVGGFASEMEDVVRQDARCNGSFAPLMVTTSESRQTTFFDMSVYSRNRAFRLVFSSKNGKNVAMVPSDRYFCGPSGCAGSGANRDETIFFNSLVNCLHPQCKFLSGSVIQHGACSTGKERRSGPAACTISGVCQRNVSSPFPQLDAWLQRLCHDKATDIRGRVRNWVLFVDSGMLLVNMTDWRFCAHVGRHHKSNGIYFLVDLSKHEMQQRCYDPECRHFRSAPIPIPLHVDLGRRAGREAGMPSADHPSAN